MSINASPKKRTTESTSMAWAVIRPFIVIFGGAFMLVMLLLLGIEADMLKEYWQSERVYAANAEKIDPVHEGCLVRVTGQLCTHEALNVGELGTYSEVIEIQNHTTIANADDLQLGIWQVQGLYAKGAIPFCYFAINTPGVNWMKVGDTRLATLPSGAEVTLVGRQRGNTLDMADPMSRAQLGKPATGYLDHVNDSPSADISLRSFQDIAIFALFAYFGTWLLLGPAIGRSPRWGMVAGAVLLLMPVAIFMMIP